MNDPKILLFDIENAPNRGWTWGKWKQNVIDFDKEFYILCFAYRWLGKGKTIVKALPDFHGYRKDKENDYKLVKCMWELFNEADIVVAHNGDRFDIKKMNTRFIINGLSPPKPYKSIDTLSIARRFFAFNSNRLDDLGKHLGVGRKIKHIGFPLWKGCMDGDRDSWKQMKRYNKQDVLLLEKVYLKLRSWYPQHPNYNIFNERDGCPTCGSHTVHKRGWGITRTGKYRRYHCQSCGSWPRGKHQKITDIR